MLVHELLPKVSVSGGYFRRQFYNQPLVRNLAINPNTDWTPFILTGPTDPRLPNGGGEQITQYNLNPAKYGVDAQRVYTYSATNRRIYRSEERRVGKECRL